MSSRNDKKVGSSASAPKSADNKVDNSDGIIFPFEGPVVQPKTKLSEEEIKRNRALAEASGLVVPLKQAADAIDAARNGKK